MDHLLPLLIIIPALLLVVAISFYTRKKKVDNENQRFFTIVQLVILLLVFQYSSWVYVKTREILETNLPLFVGVCAFMLFTTAINRGWIFARQKVS